MRNTGNKKKNFDISTTSQSIKSNPKSIEREKKDESNGSNENNIKIKEKDPNEESNKIEKELQKAQNKKKEKPTHKLFPNHQMKRNTTTHKHSSWQWQFNDLMRFKMILRHQENHFWRHSVFRKD